MSRAAVPSDEPPSRRASASGAHPLMRSLQLQERRGRLGESLERVEADVQTGLGHNEFFLVYQPRVDLATLEPVAVEALLRWDDSSRGLIRPGGFLPSVKQTKAMVALGRWVLEEACRRAAAWEGRRPPGAQPLVLSVNVAAVEILAPDFTDAVRATLDGTGLPIEMLQLEIDAGDQMGADPTVVSRLEEMRRLGLRVAIDNVAPSFDPASHPIVADRVHIHRRWVRSLRSDPEAPRGLATLVDRSHRSGALVCATGVEEQREREELSMLRCDQAQGFHFCAPVPADELDWMDDRS